MTRRSSRVTLKGKVFKNENTKDEITWDFLGFSNFSSFKFDFFEKKTIKLRCLRGRGWNQPEKYIRDGDGWAVGFVRQGVYLEPIKLDCSHVDPM